MLSILGQSEYTQGSELKLLEGDSDMEIEKDIIYDAANRLTTDIYYPTTNTARGAVIDIHGGGWFRGDKSKDADLGQKFAELGYLTFVPNYRFTQNAYYPAPLVDMDTLYQWIKKSDYQFDHDNIAAFGSSAGGNMSVEMAIKYGIPAISWSGILDIDDWLARHQDVVPKQDQTQNFNGASAEINQSVKDDSFYKWFVTNYFNGRTDQFVEATPYHRVNQKTGPIFLANSLDEFVPNTGVLKMSDKLAANQIVHAVRFVAGTKHAKGYMNEVFDEAALFLSKWF